MSSLIFKELNKEEKENIYKCLETFVYYFSDDNPFSKFINIKKSKTFYIKDIEAAFDSLINRRSKESTIIQILIMEIDIELKNMNFIREDLKPNVNLYFNNPDSTEGQSIAARARMHLNDNYQHLQISKSWAQYFWKKCTIISPIKGTFPLRLFNENENMDSITRFSTKFINYISILINEIWSKLGINLYEQELYEVLGAILSRQVVLALKIVENPGIWDWHVGPIILRSMTENYITVKWILKEDSIGRARKLIDYGLGQEKLYIENLKNKMESIDDIDVKNKMQIMINSRTAWINSQHYTFLQDINVGSWSGISIRQMANESNCLEYYKFTFSPWSFCTHNSWNHISIFNSKPNKNSIHKYVKEPYIIFSEPEIDLLFNSLQYLEDLFKLIIEHYEIECSQKTVIEWFYQNIGELLNE